MDADDKARYFLQFNRVEGDVRCCAHVYNLAVQAGYFYHIWLLGHFAYLRMLTIAIIALTSLKSAAAANRHHYSREKGKATAPSPEERSAFFVARCLVLIFKFRKLPREELQNACQFLKIPFFELVNDMPVRWSSTKKMLDALLHMEQAIRMVLARQE